jgi:hypothetical protein
MEGAVHPFANTLPRVASLQRMSYTHTPTSRVHKTRLVNASPKGDLAHSS